MTLFQRGLLVGAIGIVAVALVLGAMLAQFGAYSVAADAPHLALTRAIIGYIREQSIESRADAIKVPSLGNPKMIVEGAEHYSAMCTGCHLAPGMRENEMRPGMNPQPPILWKLPPGDPAEQFWVIKHGIKMTGMPAWGITHSDEEIWNMVAFLKVLPKLSPAMYRALVVSSGQHRDQDMPMNVEH